MSLTSALAAATSGLSAAARSAELVSSNVSNALTPGYGRREISLGASVVGGVGVGVQILGVERMSDPVATGLRRFADAAFGQAQQYANFFRGLENAIGTPDSPNSLTGRVAALEAALVTATASPESDAQLGQAVNAARGLVHAIGSASDAIQRSRQDADRTIAGQVELLNGDLAAISDLNDQIKTSVISGGDPSGLMDQRQKLVDQIIGIMPVRELQRENGRIALITNNGTMLVNSQAAQFLFNPTPTIVPEMTLESGGLSGLTITNADSIVGNAMQIIAGGSLAANFDIRDKSTIDAQSQLDSLARDLIERTSDPAVDPTLAGGAGLFTDSDGNFVPGSEVGLASRLSVNSLLDPSQGGEAWRLRDGIGATASGSVADTSILTAIADSLKANGSLSRSSISVAAAGVSSSVGVSRGQFEAQEVFSAAQVSLHQEQESRSGVDTDQEMQKLLVIEQSYAANAKMIETIDQMMQSLLRI